MDIVKQREQGELPAGRQRRLSAALAALAESASVEVTPLQVNTGLPLSELFSSGTRVYVPFLPGANFDESIAACRKLIADGMWPVAHLPARAVPSSAALDQWLAALAETGTNSLLVIAGDLKTMAGPYSDTLRLLESGLLLRHGFRHIGVAGHPQGIPYASRSQLDDALVAKLDYARSTGTDLWIVTQFAFSSDPVVGWLRTVRRLDSDLPVYVGIPGPARLKTLIGYAARCGVTVSARVLRQRPGAARLLRRWTPDGLARDLTIHGIGDPGCALNGLHVFPFGGVADCAAWLEDLRREANNSGGTAKDNFGTADGSPSSVR